jgi:hypothetical protein
VASPEKQVGKSNDSSTVALPNCAINESTIIGDSGKSSGQGSGSGKSQKGAAPNQLPQVFSTPAL